MKARLGLVALCALMLVAPAGAATRTGKVVRVVDGDTVKVKVGKRTVTVNLSGSCASETAKLRSLLPRGAKVRIKGRAIYRGSRRVTAGACPAPPQPQPTPQPPAPVPPTTPTPAPTVDLNAEFDKVLRGFKFVVHDTGSFYTQDRVQSFCTDGRWIAERILVTSGAGNEYERTDGTWKVSNVTRHEGQGIEGNIEVTSSDSPGAPPTTGFVYGGLTPDGTGFMRINGEDRLASRKPADMC